MKLRQLNKNRSLRIVNLTGLSIIFACIILSYAYIKFELSYDRFHENADRIVRLSMQYDDNPVDVRIYGFRETHPIISNIPEIENSTIFLKFETSVLTYQGKPNIVNNYYLARPDFFEFFNFNLLEGDKNTVLDTPQKAVISRKLAAQLFGDEPAVGKQVLLDARSINADYEIIVTGVFEDFPANSHIQTDLILHMHQETTGWAYTYLLLNKTADIQLVKNRLRKI